MSVGKPLRAATGNCIDTDNQGAVVVEAHSQRKFVAMSDGLPANEVR